MQYFLHSWLPTDSLAAARRKGTGGLCIKRTKFRWKSGFFIASKRSDSNLVDTFFHGLI